MRIAPPAPVADVAGAMPEVPLVPVPAPRAGPFPHNPVQYGQRDKSD